MKLKKFFICSLFLIVAAGCGKRNMSSDIVKYSDHNVFAMDTFMTMRAYGDDSENALKQSEQKILDLE